MNFDEIEENNGQKCKNKEQDEQPQSKSDEELNFEEALFELERVVSSLESGKLTLDESVAYFQRGINLSKICRNKLEQAEKKINMLVQDENGELFKQPFELEEE